jgi:hypothetical protein
MEKRTSWPRSTLGRPAPGAVQRGGGGGAVQRGGGGGAARGKARQSVGGVRNGGAVRSGARGSLPPHGRERRVPRLSSPCRSLSTTSSWRTSVRLHQMRPRLAGLNMANLLAAAGGAAPRAGAGSAGLPLAGTGAARVAFLPPKSGAGCTGASTALGDGTGARAGAEAASTRPTGAGADVASPSATTGASTEAASPPGAAGALRAAIGVFDAGSAGGEPPSSGTISPGSRTSSAVAVAVAKAGALSSQTARGAAPTGGA